MEKMEWSIFSDKLDRHDFDLVSFIQAHTTPRVDLFSSFHSSQSAVGGQNYGSYANPEVDKLLEQVREEMDESKRLPLEAKVQEILHDELPMFFMFGDKLDYMIRKGYTNTTASPTQWFQIRYFGVEGSAPAK
jgi:peptide/nickel transport system substrate-binding protein